MNLSAQEAVQNLIDALDEARAVYEAQRQNVEDACQNAEEIEEKLPSILKAQQAYAASVEAKQQMRQLYEQMRSRLPSQDEAANRRSRITSLRTRWETALCDSQLALMRLYAHSEAQSGAEQIAEMLRTLRLIQVEETPRTSVFVPPLPDEDVENGSEQVQQQHKIGIALDILQRMDDDTEQVKQSYQEKSARTEALLKQAHEEAEALAKRLTA